MNANIYYSCNHQKANVFIFNIAAQYVEQMATTSIRDEVPQTTITHAPVITGYPDDDQIITHRRHFIYVTKRPRRLD